MISFQSSLTLLCALISIGMVSSECVRDTCVHYYGARYATNSAGATLIVNVKTPTVGRDPTPCCAMCYKVEIYTIWNTKIVSMLGANFGNYHLV
jgi:hypothetical protein